MDEGILEEWTSISIYTKKGDTIKGDKIICEARKISNIQLINKSGRHKAQRIVLRDNAVCIVDRVLSVKK